MTIKDRNLAVGTKLVARYKKEDHRAEVVAGEKEGKVAYKLADGRTFTSPSAAGSAVMGGVACNGWRFWSVEGTEEEAKPRAAKKGKAKAKKAKAKRPGKAHRTGKQEKVEPPVHCGECGREFATSGEAAAHMRDEHNSPEAQAG